MSRKNYMAMAFAFLLGGCVSQAQIEQESADQFAQMREQMPLSTSVTDKAYVRCVATEIVKQLEEPYASYDWDIEVFEDEAINAFAMPGGKIGVFTGIFKVASNQDELAAVLGHEVAHVTRDHSLKRANRTMITQNTAIIGSEVLDASAGIETTDLVVMGADLVFLKPYGRGHESEADLVGLKYMANAGFDPRASIALWTNMGKESPAGPPEWLSTHPSGDTRISELAGEMSETLPLYNAAREAGRKPNCRR
ncbi:MAG: M48 family peptidase [Gammaproteobacteria bacterium]|nr:MAG: M48 family peptidase [Gammaproteobacteria bacterium]